MSTFRRVFSFIHFHFPNKQESFHQFNCFMCFDERINRNRMFATWKCISHLELFISIKTNSEYDGRRNNMASKVARGESNVVVDERLLKKLCWPNARNK